MGAIFGGRYRIVEPLRVGGMGAVYIAEHLFLHSRVALKTLRPELRDDPVARNRFTREALAGAKFAHRNLVRVIDFDMAGVAPYFVTELLVGADLRSVLDVHHRLSISRATRLIRGVLDGVAAAHRLGIVHRDLKPSNIFVVGNEGIEYCRILDFGVAAVHSAMLRRSEPLTSDHHRLGTLAYMAPEQALAAAEVDARADLYSVAAVLFEAVSGQRLSEIRTTQGGPLDVHRFVEHCPTAFSDVLGRALSHERGERYADADEFARALEPFARSQHVVSESTPAGAGRGRVAMAIVFGALLGVAQSRGSASLAPLDTHGPTKSICVPAVDFTSPAPPQSTSGASAEPGELSSVPATETVGTSRLAEPGPAERRPTVSVPVSSGGVVLLTIERANPYR